MEGGGSRPASYFDALLFNGALLYLFTNFPPFLSAAHLYVVFVRNFYSTVLPQEFGVKRTKRNTLRVSFINNGANVQLKKRGTTPLGTQSTKVRSS
jgi:hypothetical protein